MTNLIIEITCLKHNAARYTRPMRGIRRKPHNRILAKTVPQIVVSDLNTSLSFWCDLLGFTIAYQHPKDEFVCLEQQVVEIVLNQSPDDQKSDVKATQSKDRGPIHVVLSSIEPSLKALTAVDWPLYQPVQEVWRDPDGEEISQRNFLMEDPDGYVVMIAEAVDNVISFSN